MKLKFSRDVARTVTEKLFPWVYMAARSKMTDSPALAKKMSLKVVSSVISGVHLQMNKKLAGDGVNFTVNLSDAEVLCLYNVLMKMPVPADNNWLVKVRQDILNCLHDEVLELVEYQPGQALVNEFANG